MNKYGKAFRDVDLYTDKIAEEYQELANAPDVIEEIGKKLSKYAADVEGGAQEVAQARVGAATAMIGGAFGSAEFKKIISDGLKSD